MKSKYILMAGIYQDIYPCHAQIGGTTQQFGGRERAPYPVHGIPTHPAPMKKKPPSVARQAVFRCRSRE